MSRRASAKAKSRHTKLMTELSNYIAPQVDEIRYEQFQNRLRDLLNPLEQKQSKNIMDILQCLERRGTISVGKYDEIKTRLNEFDVKLGDMIDDAVDDIAKFESENGAVTSSDSGSSSRETKEKKNLPDEQVTASPTKRMKTDKPKYKRGDKQKGLMLIFNVKKDRPGTDQDVEKIRSLFERELSFHVELCEDLSKEHMKKKLELYQQYLSFSMTNDTFYCFFVVIMSHGNKDGIVTADEEKTVITFDEIFAYFQNDKIGSFAGKPRVFLIQSCRGSQAQAAHDIPDDEPPENISVSDYIGKVTIPTDSDTLVAYATTPGTKSFRRPSSDTGAWFINALIEILREKYTEEHLEEMLISVREKVAFNEEYRTNSNKCQMPCVWTTLTKRLFLEKA